MKKSLLVLNYKMDSSDGIFGHQVQSVWELAKDFERVYVVTGSIGEMRIPSNTYVVSTYWEPGARLKSSIRFYRQVLKFIFKKDLVIFSHMTEVQSALIAPLTRILRIPHWLWYAHAKKSKFLTWDHFFLNGIVTSSPGSCPIKGGRVHPIGQAIDPRMFPPTNSLKQREPIKLLHFGRFDPSKNIPGIIQNCLEIRSKGIDLEFLQVGRSSNKKYEKLSSEIIEGYSNLAWVNFHDSVARSELPSILSDAFAFIHNYQGSLDKTLIEATMHAVPVLTVNLEYLQIFGSWGDLKDLTLSSEFWALYNLSQVEIYSELQRRRELAISAHSLDHWTRSLIQILGRST